MISFIKTYMSRNFSVLPAKGLASSHASPSTFCGLSRNVNPEKVTHDNYHGNITKVI